MALADVHGEMSVVGSAAVRDPQQKQGSKARRTVLFDRARINVKAISSSGSQRDLRGDRHHRAAVYDLWEVTDPLPGRFRASAFEYRPCPGTPDWHRLLYSWPSCSLHASPHRERCRLLDASTLRVQLL
jgi:hypothetical protein